MTDSSTLFGDPDALRSRLRRDGYVLVRGALPSYDVAAVASSMRSHLCSAGHTTTDGRPLGPALVEGDATHLAVYRSIQADEGFHRLAHHPTLVGLMATLLDIEPDHTLVHPRKIARLTFPDNVFGTTPPHQDYPLIQGTADVLTAWIPLIDCPARMGGLKVLAGSHHGGIRTARPRDAVGKMGLDVPDDDPQWVSTEFRVGDVLVFHSFTVHGAVPNRSDRVRISADYRYQHRAAPLVEESLHPHFHPDVPDWTQLTVDWTSDRWVRADDGLDVISFRFPTEPLLPPPSNIVDVGDQPRPALVLS